MKTYFESNRGKLCFQKEKTYYGNTLWSAGSISIKLRGSFKSLPTEEVSLNLGCRILNGGWRSDREGKRERGRQNKAGHGGPP